MLVAVLVQIFIGIKKALKDVVADAPLQVSIAHNVRMSLRCRIRIAWPDADAGPTAHTS